MQSLKMGAIRFSQARTAVIETRLIAYQHPLYQVLALGVDAIENKQQLAGENSPERPRPPVAIKAILQKLAVARSSHD
jgi:hypothetical protein